MTHNLDASAWASTSSRFLFKQIDMHDYGGDVGAGDTVLKAYGGVSVGRCSIYSLCRPIAVLVVGCKLLVHCY